MQNQITMQEIVNLLHQYKSAQELSGLLTRVKTQLEQTTPLPASKLRTVADVAKVVTANGIYEAENRGVIITQENPDAGEFSISDVHGNFGALCSLLPKIIETLNNGGVVIANGDMIDPVSGEDTAQLEVLLTLFILMDKYPQQCFFTKGNHESGVNAYHRKEILGEQHKHLYGLLGDILNLLPAFVVSCPTGELYSHTGAFDPGIGPEERPSVKNLFTQTVYDMTTASGDPQYDPINTITMNPTALANAKAVGFRRVNKGHDHMIGEMIKASDGQSVEHVRFTDEFPNSAQVCQTFSNPVSSRNRVMALPGQSLETLQSKLNNGFMRAEIVESEHGGNRQHIQLETALPSCYIHDSAQEAIVSFVVPITTAESLVAIDQNDSSRLPHVTQFADARINLPQTPKENLASNSGISPWTWAGIILAPTGIGLVILAVRFIAWPLIKHFAFSEKNSNVTTLPAVKSRTSSVVAPLSDGEGTAVDPNYTPPSISGAAIIPKYTIN